MNERATELTFGLHSSSGGSAAALAAHSIHLVLLLLLSSTPQPPLHGRAKPSQIELLVASDCPESPSSPSVGGCSSAQPKRQVAGAEELLAQELAGVL